MAATKSPREKKDKKEGSLSGWEKAALVAIRLIDRAFDTFGVPMTVLFGIFLVVYKFGSKQTQDDFIRELLFRGVTQTVWLQVFFVGLVGVAIYLGVKAQRRGHVLEGKEMQRLADEKTQLQEKLAEKELNHSAPPPDETASDEKSDQ